jgi:hypothetical protein
MPDGEVGFPFRIIRVRILFDHRMPFNNSRAGQKSGHWFFGMFDLEYPVSFPFMGEVFRFDPFLAFVWMAPASPFPEF